MKKIAKTCFITALAASATLSAMAESTAAKSKIDPESAKIVQRMKAMRLPEVSFKPPATIIDAVEFFRVASKDFDSPKIPKEMRGFNFMLRVDGSGEAPEIPMITAKDISFYDAMKLVCESVDYMFVVAGQIIIVESKEMHAQMEKEMALAEKAEAARKVVQAHPEDFGSTPYRRFRFSVNAPRSDGCCMQLSEIVLLDAKGKTIPRSAFTIAYDSSTIPENDDNPFPDNERPENAVDGDYSTKWLDWRAGLDEADEVRAAVWLEFRFKKPTTVCGYRWYTANDEPGRTPVSWTLMASDDEGATWRVLDKVENYKTTFKTNALAYELGPTRLP